MQAITPISKFFNNLIDVPSIDPDDSRRRKILNIILIGMVAASAITALLTVLASALRLPGTEDISSIMLPSAAALASCFFVYILNRYWSGIVASGLFLVFLMYILTLTDTPHELANGRSIYLLAIPIIISSVLLGSKASLVFWGLISAQLIYLAQIAGDAVNVPAIMSFFFLALISWLSARSLEQALKDLRIINTELDQRVVERTQELSDALSRETVEAGRREAILNSIGDGVVVFDRNGKAILANPSIANLINKPQKKIVGSGMDELLNSEDLKFSDREKIAAHLEKSAQDLSNFRVEWGKRTLSVSAAEVRDGKDQPIGTVAVMRDFTREAELEKMKDTFMAIVSHELRTPLNAILGYSEMFIESVYGPLNEKQLSVSMRIMSNSQRLLRIVSDLLDQAQIEAGKLKVRMTPFKPAELVENFHSVMDKIAADKGLQLVTELEPSMPSTIIGDSQRLQQIMVNLANNAVKFTEEGGIFVRIFNFDEQNWRIQVTDTGPGIPHEAKDYIFESFRQMEGASTREHGGVGLGLTIVKQLVELMHGSIEVTSGLGKGSIFTVTLPLILNTGTSTQPVLNHRSRS